MELLSNVESHIENVGQMKGKNTSYKYLVRAMLKVDCKQNAMNLNICSLTTCARLNLEYTFCILDYCLPVLLKQFNLYNTQKSRNVLLLLKPLGPSFSLPYNVPLVCVPIIYPSIIKYTRDIL